MLTEESIKALAVDWYKKLDVHVMYGAFLEEAAAWLQDDRVANISEEFTRAGDLWRASAVKMAGVYKGRYTDQKDFDEIADMMLNIRSVEKEAFENLSRLKLGK